MMTKKVFSFHERIVNSPCYISNGSFNSRCLVALIRFICLERQLSLSFYDLKNAEAYYKAFNDEENDNKIKSDAQLHCLYFLEHSLVGYNNCIDTILQIVYFIFECLPDFFSKTEFDDLLRGCKWGTINSHFTSFTKSHTDSIASQFFHELKDFYSKGKKVRDKANALKHHGGITTKDFQIPCPPGYTLNVSHHHNPSFIINPDEIKQLIDESKNNIFSPISVLPLVVDIKETIIELQSQHENILDFAYYLFDISGLFNATNKDIDITQTFHPPFSIIDGTENK